MKSRIFPPNRSNRSRVAERCCFICQVKKLRGFAAPLTPSFRVRFGALRSALALRASRPNHPLHEGAEWDEKGRNLFSA